MIERLTLTNYRSYRQHSFDLHPTATIIVGPNATGKTNLLEALYVLAKTKSFRAKDQELIFYGQNFFRIEGLANGTVIGLGYQLEPKATKRLDYNKVKRPLIRHVGSIPTVLFEPNDLQLLTGPPTLRRRYLDGILGQHDPSYLKALNQYQRILKQRNSLLERFDMAAVKAQIFAWDVNLAEAAGVIVNSRQQLLDWLTMEAAQFYEAIAGQSARVNFNYLPTITSENAYTEAFLNQLALNLPRDLAAGFTTIGPHREDFGINFKGRPVETIASRGEIRSLVLALKLAELERLHSQDGLTPLLLLDDVFSELDDARRRFLISRLDGFQSVITTTDADIAAELKSDRYIIETNHLERYAAD